MRRVQIAIPLLLVYLALSGNASLPNLVVGAMVALGASLLLPLRSYTPIPWKRIPAFLWAMFRYVFVVLWDVVRGGVATARIVLSPRMSLKTGIITIPSGSKTELGTALSAHAITLSPGELVVEMDDEGNMYTHCLDVEESAAYVAEAQSLRRNLLSKMFE